MGFLRDRNARTRGIGAIAALDQVSDAGRRAHAQRARDMARRDAVMARTAMGAVSMGTRGATRDMSATSGTITFDAGKPTVPGTGGPGGNTGGGVIVTGGSRAVSAAIKSAATDLQAIPHARPSKPMPPVVLTDPVLTNSQPAPPPLPKPPSAPSSSSGGGGGGGWGGGGSSGGSDVITAEAQPDVIEPSSPSPSITGKQIAIGAGILLGLYYLSKKA